MGNLLRCLLLTLKTTFRFRQTLQTFTIIIVINNNYPRISSKMGLTIEDEALIVNNN
jgi:hypothetical protein